MNTKPLFGSFNRNRSERSLGQRTQEIVPNDRNSTENQFRSFAPAQPHSRANLEKPFSFNAPKPSTFLAGSRFARQETVDDHGPSSSKSNFSNPSRTNSGNREESRDVPRSGHLSSSFDGQAHFSLKSKIVSPTSHDRDCRSGDDLMNDQTDEMCSLSETDHQSSSDEDVADAKEENDDKSMQSHDFIEQLFEISRQMPEWIEAIRSDILEKVNENKCYQEDIQKYRSRAKMLSKSRGALKKEIQALQGMIHDEEKNAVEREKKNLMQYNELLNYQDDISIMVKRYGWLRLQKEKECFQLISALDAKKLEVGTFGAKLEQTQHEATLTKAKLRDESKRSSELENELVDTKARLNSAVESNQNLESALATEKDSHNRRIADLENALRDMNVQDAEHKELYKAQLYAQECKAQEVQASYEQAAQELNRRIMESNNHSTEFKLTLEKTNEKLELTIAEREDLLLQNKTLKSQFSSLRNEKDKEIELLLQRLSNETQSGKEAIIKISALLEKEKSKAPAFTKELQDVRSELKKANQNRARIEGELQKLTKKGQEMRMVMNAERQELIASCDRVFSSMNHQSVNFMKQLSTFTSRSRIECASYQESLKALMDTAKKRSDHLSNQIHYLQHELRNLRSLNSTLVCDISAQKKDIEDATRVAHEAVMEQNSLRQLVTESERKLVDLSNDREHFRNALQDASLKLLKSTEELRKQNADLHASNLKLGMMQHQEETNFPKANMILSQDSLNEQVTKPQRPTSRARKKQKIRLLSLQHKAINTEADAVEKAKATPIPKRSRSNTAKKTEANATSRQKKPMKRKAKPIPVAKSDGRSDDGDAIFEEDL